MNNVEEWIAEYERVYGQRPSELVVKICDHILKVSDILTDRGREDARNGQRPYPEKYFPVLARRAFHLDPDVEHDAVDKIGYLWWTMYMKGYEEADVA